MAQVGDASVIDSHNDKERSSGHGFVPTQRSDTYLLIDPLQWNLAGKTILITGAARGLGREMALSYAKAGVSGIIMLDSLDARPVEEDLLVAADSAGRPRPSLLSLKVDVTSESSVADAAKVLQSQFDSIDIVINNAGVLTYVPILESSPTTWWRCMEVNVKGPYLIARAFLPLVLKSSLKTIIVVSSVGAHFNLPGGSAYEMSKQVVLKFNEGLMIEHEADGLLAYAIAPGGVRTGMLVDFPSQYHERLTDSAQLVADTLVFLSKERREWLACRYVDSRWDMEELMQKKAEIVEEDLLKVRLAVGIAKGSHI